MNLETVAIAVLSGVIGGLWGVAIVGIAQVWKRSSDCRPALKRLGAYTLIGTAVALFVMLVMRGHLS